MLCPQVENKTTFPFEVPLAELALKRFRVMRHYMLFQGSGMLTLLSAELAPVSRSLGVVGQPLQPLLLPQFFLKPGFLTIIFQSIVPLQKLINCPPQPFPPCRDLVLGAEMKDQAAFPLKEPITVLALISGGVMGQEVLLQSHVVLAFFPTYFTDW